ncbi:hypothetical protein [Paraburkholderia sp. J41]|uniref:hypothetical protein n=1 Tax=Paraburkholderia sp. J41 TaxID=2805433 RepID=UPI002AC36B2E|nr:hypothetical protein [Paraburkholderia sp. J41]
MYSVGDYFIECLMEHRPGDGWTALARISRRDDYRKAQHVPKALFHPAIERHTRHDAERAAVQWARAKVSLHREEIERAIERAGSRTGKHAPRDIPRV